MFVEFLSDVHPIYSQEKKNVNKVHYAGIFVNSLIYQT
jgi:hypothetical protein